MIASLLLVILLVWLGFLISVDYYKSKSVSHSHAEITEEEYSIDVVIAARNEEQNIYNCLESISAQEGELKLSIIVVNDHSTDQTSLIVEQFTDKHPSLKVLLVDNRGEGKKNALKLATEFITSTHVFFTDADCILAPNALSSSIYCQQQSKSKAVLGMVSFQGKSLMSKLVQVENLNNMAVTEASVNAEIPMLANGANLLINQDVLDIYKTSLSQKSPSGDDVFFIQALKNAGLYYVFNPKSIVFTAAPESGLAFINQRLRWAKKSAGYKHIIGRLLPVFVWCVNVGFISGVVTLFSSDVLLAFIFISIKFLLEFGFHKTWNKSYQMSTSVWHELLTSLIYPIYVFLIGLLVLFDVKYQWKDRIHE